jgi:hypothetical protein
LCLETLQISSDQLFRELAILRSAVAPREVTPALGEEKHGHKGLPIF